MRLGLGVVAEASEEDVVGPRLAEFQRVVAGLGAAGADHHLGLEALDRLGEFLRASFDVDAVGMDTAGDAAVARDDDGDAGHLGDRHDLLGKSLERGVVHAVFRQDQRCDIAAFEGRTDVFRRRKRRGDQHDSAAVGRRCFVH